MRRLRSDEDARRSGVFRLLSLRVAALAGLRIRRSGVRITLGALESSLT